MLLSCRVARRLSAVALAGALLGACQPFGPSRGDFNQIGRIVPGNAGSSIEVIKVGADTAVQLATPATPSFAQVLSEARPVGTTVGVGDALELTIWEAPPATLFGAATTDTRIGTAIATARPTTLPELLVGPEGTINVPFAGIIPAANRTLREIEIDIVRRLQGRANAPQALARVVRNATATVTVVGEVSQSARLPLTPRGERLLDVIAQAGGVKAPVNQTTIQVTRGPNSYRMALSDIIERGENNVVLARDDVVTALFQPYSFTVLGAAGRNDEIRFEAMGITLSQALGRIGGLRDGKADPRGVFLFRWQPPEQPGAPMRPVIYSFDLKDPAVFFLAQQFKIKDQDMIFITNSPVAELQRFVNIVASTILPLATVESIVTR